MTIEQLIRDQRAAHRAALPVSHVVREERLQRLINAIVDHREALCDAMEKDFGVRGRTFSMMNDIAASLMSLNHAKKRVKKWMRPSRRMGVAPFSWFGARGIVEKAPKGVVGIIGAWNAPLFTLLAPSSSALAAGNRVVLKPSEFAPATARALQVAIEAVFPADELAVITGDADLAAQMTCADFDQLIFTGGGETGKKVMSAAAKNLTPVILELGGKSPVIVGKNADIEIAAERIALAKGANAGQLCVAPDTIYVPVERVEKFIELLAVKYEAFFPFDDATTTIINNRHFNRIRSYLTDARTSGAAVETTQGKEDSEAKRLPFHIVCTPREDAEISQNEIFGPAIVVHSYKDIKNVVSEIAQSPTPLALYYFGRDKAEERFVLDNTPSGGAAVNDVMLQAALNDAPFGGLGGSGMGCYHGEEGFNALSHCRTIYRAGWWDPRKAFGMFPPYSDRMAAMVEKTVAGFRKG